MAIIGWRQVVALLVLFGLAGCRPAEHLLVETSIESEGVEPLEDSSLALFVNGLDNYVFTGKGATLLRLGNGGRTLEPLYTFDDQIAGIHTTATGLVLVATDRDPWDPATPCRVFVSRDGTRSFELTKEINGGCALWWSFASAADGTLYLGEYGPKKKGMSKIVWRSRDAGTSWESIFHVPLKDNNHIHRVAVDPYSSHVWVTVGDNSNNRGTFCSTDSGDTWQKLRASQATGVAFTEQGIYWGEDNKKGEISFTNRQDGTTSNVLNVSHLGNYGGSVYDLAVGRSGRIYAPFMKYGAQTHIATLWSGTGTEWRLLIRLASRPGQGVNVPTVAGPDRDGWLYISGYRIRDGS